MLLEFIGSSYLTSSIRGNIRWAAAELLDVPEDGEDEAAVCLSIACDIYSFDSIALQVSDLILKRKVSFTLHVL
jgi:hypothetical protein